MPMRPTVIVMGITLIIAIIGLAYLWNAREAGPSGTGMDVGAMPAQSEALTAEASDAPGEEAETRDEESIERLMGEIEAAAQGDATALEDEFAAESESFMEGAVVLQQLGQSYDETSY